MLALSRCSIASSILFAFQGASFNTSIGNSTTCIRLRSFSDKEGRVPSVENNTIHPKNIHIGALEIGARFLHQCLEILSIESNECLIDEPVNGNDVICHPQCRIGELLTTVPCKPNL